MEVETSEPSFYLLTYDQTPDAHVTKSGHYAVDAQMRVLAGESVREPPYGAIVLNWQRGRSTVTAPCFLAVAMGANAWRIEQYADGQQTTAPSELTFAVISERVDDVVVATDDEIRDAMRFAFERLRVVLEPSGACALAAVLAGHVDVADKRIGVTLSGGNIDVARFADILDPG